MHTHRHTRDAAALFSRETLKTIFRQIPDMVVLNSGDDGAAGTVHYTFSIHVL